MKLAKAVAGVLTGIVALSGASSITWAAKAPPPAGADFSGVWRLSSNPDGSGPSPFDASMDPRHPDPPLNAEWKAEWEKTLKRKRAGMKIWDPAIHCLPPGMPHTMNGSYPMEILMTPGRVTVITENFNEIRRIWTDGRGHPPADELEYTFVGDSVGHWQGGTLQIDTVGVREEGVLDVSAIPHSDKIHITEEVHLVGKDQLDWTITLVDPVVYSRPWTAVKHFIRSPPTEQVREYVCADNNPVDEKYNNPGPDDAKYDHPDPRLKTRDN